MGHLKQEVGEGSAGAAQPEWHWDPLEALLYPEALTAQGLSMKHWLQSFVDLLAWVALLLMGMLCLPQ